MHIRGSKPDFFLTAPDETRHLSELGAAMGIHVAQFPMGDWRDPATPGAIVVYMGPGQVLHRHSHDCERFEIIISGSLDVGDDVLGPGDVMIARPGEFYGPHIAGPTGCVMCEVFSVFSQSWVLTLPGLDGTPQRFDMLQGENPPEDLVHAACRPVTS